MALNDLSLSVTSGVQGRPFRSAVIGLTAGSQVSLDEDAAPGFSFVNGFLSHQALPYEVNVAALRERLTTGETKVTRLSITAATASALSAHAVATVPVGRTMTGFRVAANRQQDGSDVWSIYVDDTVGATTSVAVGGTPAAVPSAPRNLTATPGPTQVTLSWQAPLTADPAVTDYIPEFKLSANTVWQQFTDGTSTSLTALVTGLTNGSAYDFRVRAVNAAGQSDPSNVVSATPVAPAYDADAQLYFNAVPAGKLSPGRKAAINKLIIALKADTNPWAQIDGLTLGVNYTQEAAVIDVKRPNDRRWAPGTGATWSQTGGFDCGTTSGSGWTTIDNIAFSGSKFAAGSAPNAVAAGFGLVLSSYLGGAQLIFRAGTGTGQTSLTKSGVNTQQATAVINSSGTLFPPTNSTATYPQSYSFMLNGTDSHSVTNGYPERVLPGVTAGTTPASGGIALIAGASRPVFSIFYSSGYLTGAQMLQMHAAFATYLAYVEEPINVNDTALTNGWPSLSDGQSVVVSGTYDPTIEAPPASVEVAFEQDGATIMAKRPATLISNIPGEWSAKVTSPAPLNLIASKSPKARVYLDGSTTPIVQPFTPTPYGAIEENIPSINYYTNTYFSPNDVTVDLTPRLTFRTMNPATGKYVLLWTEESVPLAGVGGTLNADGVLTKWLDGSTGQSIVHCHVARYLYDDRVNQEFEVIGFPPNTTLSLASVGPITITNPGPSGNPRFKYTARTTVNEFLFTVPNIPAGGIDFTAITMRPVSASPSDYVTAGERESQTGVKLIRFMQGDKINTDEVVPATAADRLGRNMVHFKNMRPEDGYGLDVMVGICNDLGADLWYNVPRDASNAYVLKAAQYILANLNSGLKCWIEYANERWNFAGVFGNTHLFVAARGYERGLESATATASNTTKIRDVISPADLWNLPYRLTDLTTYSEIAAETVFPVNMDLSPASGFGSSGTRYVKTKVIITTGQTLSLANCTVLDVIDATEQAKWLPYDRDGKVWRPIPSNSYFVLSISKNSAFAIAMGNSQTNGFYFGNSTADIPAGGTITSSNYSLGDNQIDPVQYRYGLQREVEIFTIFDGVFGANARTRLRRIHAERALVNPTEIVNRFAWIGNPSAKFDVYCIATYMSNPSSPGGYPWMPGKQDHGDPGAWNLQAGKVEYPGWTPTTGKATFTANPPMEWANRFLYGTPDGSGDVLDGPTGLMVQSLVNYTVNFKHQIEAGLQAIPGYVPQSIGLVSYESGWQCALEVAGAAGYGDGHDHVNSAAASAYNYLVDLEGAGDIVRYFYGEFRDKIGLCHNQFCDKRASSDEGAAGFKRYSLMNDLYDTDAPMLRGFREAHGISG